MTPKQQLSAIIEGANQRYYRIQQLLLRANNNPSRLSYSDKYEIKELACQFLINMNAVVPLIERQPSLMMESVPGIEGVIPISDWMQWAMKWFDSFEATMKPVLF